MMSSLSFASGRRAATGVLACVLLSACGSGTEPADDASAAQVVPDAAATQSAGSSSDERSADASGLDSWMEYPAVASSPSSTAGHHFTAPPPAPPPDPDAAIERFEKECSAESTSETCRVLRREVESGFLQAILVVRASDEPVDPEWYRVAATADMPQLACIGVNELFHVQGRTAEDEAIIVDAFDHPAPSVRAAAYSYSDKIPVLAELAKRASRIDHGLGACLDGTTDYVPGVKWAGNYPGARFRAFASNNTRRWFTTPDPVDKVLDWFAKAGKPGRTREQVSADAAAQATQEMMRLSSSSDPADQDRLMKLVTGGGGMAIPNFDWDTSSHMEGIGEVKYVVLTDKQAIAVFRDDFMKATSIVAPHPRAPLDLKPDVEKVKREMRARAILGY